MCEFMSLSPHGMSVNHPVLYRAAGWQDRLSKERIKADRQINKQTSRQADKQVGRQAGQAVRLTGREAARKTDRKKEWAQSMAHTSTVLSGPNCTLGHLVTAKMREGMACARGRAR